MADTLNQIDKLVQSNNFLQVLNKSTSQKASSVLPSNRENPWHVEIRGGHLSCSGTLISLQTVLTFKECLPRRRTEIEVLQINSRFDPFQKRTALNTVVHGLVLTRFFR